LHAHLFIGLHNHDTETFKIKYLVLNSIYVLCPVNFLFEETFLRKT